MDSCSSPAPGSEAGSPVAAPPSLIADQVEAGTDDYARLQRRLLVATAAVTVAVALLTWVLVGGSAARSLALGGACGLLYMRLLARSVGRLGPESRSLGRFQIVVPALLVVAAAKVPAIELLPALAGFVLYKPALLLQAFLNP